MGINIRMLFIKKRDNLQFIKIFLVLFSVLMKLNVIILLPLGFYAEKNWRKAVHYFRNVVWFVYSAFLFFSLIQNNITILEFLRQSKLPIFNYPNIIIGIILLIMFSILDT